MKKELFKKHNTGGELSKAHIAAVLCALKREYHHIYALFECATSTELFCIKLDSSPGIKFLRKKEKQVEFSLREFFSSYERFSDKDRFLLIFNTVTLDSEENCKVGIIEVVYKYYLYVICEKAIYADQPFDVSDSVAHRYGLTPLDIARVKPLIKSLNSEIIQSLQEEYDTLKNLRCLKK